jgi:heme-degrading monooxygenase HmoA
MVGRVLTVVSAAVNPEQEEHLAMAYQAVLDADVPDGILASALLRGDGNQWQIITLWRDRAALDAMSAHMRVNPELPAAPRVFREVGAEPTLAVFDVINGLQRPA